MSRDPADWTAAFEAVSAAARGAPVENASTPADLDAIRVRFLGRNGQLNKLLKSLKDLSLKDRKTLGPKAQREKELLEGRIARRQAMLEAGQDLSLPEGCEDLTLPAAPPRRGRLHPLTLIQDEIVRILSLMGFECAEGPLIETDRYNFSALNVPEDHPARDMHDTFYLKDLPLLLRTHTSPVQIREMEKRGAPLRLICPGRVFRHDQVDATHSAIFHQVEGLWVDRRVTFADLKGTLAEFMKALLGPATQTRFRPSYFPFTEPSAEVDVSCLFCSGSGCGVCKRSGWIEMMGAGVVNPNVFRAVNLDPGQWSGFAFGMGVERLAMIKYGIDDIRHFYEGDLRFLRQFDEDIVGMA